MLVKVRGRYTTREIIDSYEGDIEGFVLNEEHSHQPQSMGTSVREKMLCKGEKRARELRDSVKTIIDDLEAEFLTVENAATVATRDPTAVFLSG